MPSLIIKYFDFAHLPRNLQRFVAPMKSFAMWYDEKLPDCAEKTTGLRKLLEAKDCFVRAALDLPDEQS